MRFSYAYRKKAKLFANSGDPDQMSDLGLHCLLITRLGVSRLQWVMSYLNPSPAELGYIPCFCKQCSSRSVGFWICTVRHYYVNIY